MSFEHTEKFIDLDPECVNFGKTISCTRKEFFNHLSIKNDSRLRRILAINKFNFGFVEYLHRYTLLNLVCDVSKQKFVSEVLNQ